ncbi:hypothetical protein GALL_508550 [mine drainage metagenome]|uniref:Uncharacterized protein n=1 Tax=mine drainage metagenome TaxID=410659 RepID=A0A1J5P8I2_9ZZZZ
MAEVGGTGGGTQQDAGSRAIGAQQPSQHGGRNERKFRRVAGNQCVEPVHREIAAGQGGPTRPAGGFAGGAGQKRLQLRQGGFGQPPVGCDLAAEY